MKKLKNEKGITIIVLVITIIIMLIISVPVVINTKNISELQRYTNFKSDIDVLRETIETTYITTKNIDTIGPKYTGSISFLDYKQDGINVKNPNDNEIYYVIDLKKINNNINSQIELNYGSGNKIDNYSLLEINQGNNVYEYNGGDVYIINSKTRTIYYTDGIEYKGKKYYRLSEAFNQIQDIYVVSYDVNGGENTPKMQTVIAGTNTSIFIGAVPYKEGYSFKGWLNKNDNIIYQPNEEYIPQKNVLFVAQWEKTQN